MSIPIHDQKTGGMFLRQFDSGVLSTLGATPDPSDPVDPCYALHVQFVDGLRKVPVYFSQPEAIFKKKVFPFVVVNRDDISLAMHRWMGVGQLEYRVRNIDTQELTTKPQAFPHDLTYTISVWDRYEPLAQTILKQVLKALNPVGRLLVNDSLGLQRSYEYYWEGSIANLQEIIDPVTRARGYALTIRVEGELDLVDEDTSGTVSGVDLFLHRTK